MIFLRLERPLGLVIERPVDEGLPCEVISIFPQADGSARIYWPGTADEPIVIPTGEYLHVTLGTISHAAQESP